MAKNIGFALFVGLVIPGLFVLDLWLSYLTGNWLGGLVGDKSGQAAWLTGFFAFFFYGMAFAWAFVIVFGELEGK